MIMEMKLCYNDNFKGLDNLPTEFAKYIEGVATVKESSYDNGLVVTLKEPHALTYHYISSNAKVLGIQIFDRKALYVTLAEKVTEEMYDDPENWITNPHDPYYTKEDIGTYKQFCGNQVNTFYEAEEEAKKYGYPERNLKISIRVIEDDKARID
jgi:hypothetical protein